MNDRISRPSDFLPVVFFLTVATIAGYFLLQADEEVRSVPLAETRVDTQDVNDTTRATVEETTSVALRTDVPQEPTAPEGSQTNMLTYMDNAFTTLSRWQPAEVRPLLSPSTAQAVNDEQLGYVLDVLQNRLGGLVSYETPAAVPMTPSEQARTDDASLHGYKFEAHYTEGEAVVNLVLEETPTGFSLYHFDIEMKQGSRPVASLN